MTTSFAPHQCSLTFMSHVLQWQMYQVQAAEHCILLIQIPLPQLKSDHQPCSTWRFEIPHSQNDKVK
jgi:hypothetical protein